MASLNRWTGIGNCGKDCEPVRYTNAGQAVTQFSIACTERNGEREFTEWITVVVWGKQAEIAAQYIRKGRQVYVEGRLQTRDWVDPQGVKHWKTECVCQRFLLLGKREDDGIGRATAEYRSDRDGQVGIAPAFDDYDIGELGPPLDQE